MNAGKRAEIFRRFQAANPAPTTELEYSTPFELLIAVILSAQATDKSVNLATRRLFPVAGTPAKLLALGEAGLLPYIQSIGLYRTKAKNVLATSRAIFEQHGGEVPRSREALEALPGVGRKTANVVLNTAFGEATIAVDTHIFRVANRTGIASGDNVLEVEQKLLKFVPEVYRKNAHHWLILHGRYTCKALKPDCPRCLIRDLCEYRYKTREEGGRDIQGAKRKDEGGRKGHTLYQGDTNAEGSRAKGRRMKSEGKAKPAIRAKASRAAAKPRRQ